MTSKAEKLRQHRLKQLLVSGRPKKEGVERYKSGGIKRQETEKETLSVAVSARQKIHNINPKSIRDQKAGSTLGRMRLDGKIEENEYQAGALYAEQMEAYYRAVGIPSPNPRAQDILSVRGYDGEVSETAKQRARNAKNTFMRLERVLLSCESGPQVRTTVYNVCIHDYENLRMMPKHQLELLKRGLQALMFAGLVKGQ